MSLKGEEGQVLKVRRQFARRVEEKLPLPVISHRGWLEVAIAAAQSAAADGRRSVGR